MLQSRFVVPVISPSAIAAWQKFDQSFEKFDPVLMYACSGFAALEMARCSRKMSSRVENIFPIIAEGILDSKKQSDDMNRGCRCIPDFLVTSPRIFHRTPGKGFFEYEAEKSHRRAYCVANDVIFCKNHCLSVNSCISLTGNLENVKIFVEEEQKMVQRKASKSGVFFVIEDGFNADQFKLSVKLGDKRPVSFQTGKESFDFKLASAFLFESFGSKSFKDAWQMIKDVNQSCFSVDDWKNPMPCANDFSSFLKDKLCVKQESCCCRVEVLRVLDSIDAKMSQDIVRLRVKLLALSGEPLKQYEFHEIPQNKSTQVNIAEMRKIVGTCVFVLRVSDADNEFEIGLSTDRGFSRKSFYKMRLCSCSKISQDADIRLSKFQRVLHQSQPDLSRVDERVEKLLQDKNWAVLDSVKDEIQSILESQCAHVLEVPPDGPCIDAKGFLADCTSLYTCVASVRVQLQKIEEIKKRAVNQKAQFEEALLNITQDLRNLSATPEFQELCRALDFASLKQCLHTLIHKHKSNYGGDFDDDEREYSSDNQLEGIKIEYDLLKNERSHEPNIGMLSIIRHRLLFLDEVNDAAKFAFLKLKSHLEGPPELEKLKTCCDLKDKILAPLREKYGLGNSIAVKGIFKMTTSGFAGEDASAIAENTYDFSKIPLVKNRLDGVPDWIDTIWLLLNKSEADDSEYQDICREIEEVDASDSNRMKLLDKRKNDRCRFIKAANNDLMMKWKAVIKEFKDFKKEMLRPADPTKQQLKHSDADINCVVHQHADHAAAARHFLRQFLHSANIVPWRQLDAFVEALYAQGLGGDENLLRESLLDDFDFEGIGMSPPQTNALFRYLRLPAASDSSASCLSESHLSTEVLLSAEVAVKKHLVDVLTRAMILPEEQRELFAQRLYDSGIADEVGLREDLLSNPSFAKKIMSRFQIRALEKFFEQ
jgi:hypothetical protein